MTHTPGPWYAYRAADQGRPDEAPIFVVGPSEFHTVAKVRAGNTDGDLPKQTEANALLIAAAPELLAALKSFLEPYDGYSYKELQRRVAIGVMDYVTMRRIMTARAAIAKAEGRV
jgi:hypothetical protein